jgi:hypothetical protein
MFENCIIKKSNNPEGVYSCIKIIYPEVNGSQKIILVPLDEENTDYQEIMKWVAEGNVIEEAD